MIEGFHELPEGWRWAKLGEVCQINPRRPRLTIDLHEPTTFVPMTSLDEGAGIIADPEILPFEQVKQGYTYFEEGDILFAKITPCMENGKAAIARKLLNGFGFGSTEFHVLRPSDFVSQEWLWLFIRQERFRADAKASFRGGVGQQRVPQQFLEQYLIPLPALDEQERIVTRIEELMGRIREALRLREEAKKDADLLMQAALAEAFPKPGSDLPPDWRWVRLGDIFDLQQGVSMSPKRRRGENPKPFLRTRNIGWGEVYTTSLDEMDFTESEIEKLHLKQGDLLVCEGGDVGRTAIWEDQLPLVLYQNHIHRLRAKDSTVLPKFFMYWMQAAYQIFRNYEKEESRTAIPNLSGSRLKAFLAPLPPIEVQKRTVEYLEVLRQKVTALKETQDNAGLELQRLEQSILDKAFQGML
jgi:type I restriction enzyme S subunit